MPVPTWTPVSRTSSYRQTAAACPRFIEGWRMSSCCSIGMVRSQWQWLSSSLLRPVFSEPKSSATRPFSRVSSVWMARAASGRACSGCWSARSPTAVVPTTSVQSATASATVAKVCASAGWRRHRRRSVRSRRERRSRSPRADGESRNRAWPGPPRRYCWDCVRVPARRRCGRVVGGESTCSYFSSAKRKRPAVGLPTAAAVSISN